MKKIKYRPYDNVGEQAKGLVVSAKRKRLCICGMPIRPGERHFRIPKGGYGYWNICAQCMKHVFNELFTMRIHTQFEEIRDEKPDA